MRRKAAFIVLAIVLALLLTACGGAKNKAGGGAGEGGFQGDPANPVVLHILENDTAKAEGYLQALLDAFNEAYKDKGIQAVDANMDEYTDLAMNGPYGYGPDVLYQANDQLMRYAEDRHILPIEAEKLDCYASTPESAWDAFKMNFDGTVYTMGVPVNIQEPMLFYREDMMPEDWQTKWDKDGSGIADFFENWCDLYAYSKELHDADPNKYGFMVSMNNLYLASPFMLSHGNYIFGEKDGVLDDTDIGFSKGDAVSGLWALRQFAGQMNEGCIDDTVTLNRYEKLADGSYFCAVSTPDTYSLFLNNLTNRYKQDGLSEEEAKEKAVENLKMVEVPARMPKSGDLGQDSSSMTDDDWTETVVMGGVNGYGISSYTKYRDACVEFVNFATSYDMLKLRADTLGIAPTRSDVAAQCGDTADIIFKSLEMGRIYLMPSIKAVDQIWVPCQTVMGDVAKDPFREKQGEAPKYPGKTELQAALESIDRNIYDAIHTLAG